jgi:hypothetical protein
MGAEVDKQWVLVYSCLGGHSPLTQFSFIFCSEFGRSHEVQFEDFSLSKDSDPNNWAF